MIPITVGVFSPIETHLAGGLNNYCLFLPLFGEDSHFDSYFSDGLKSPTSHLLWGHFFRGAHVTPVVTYTFFCDGATLYYLP